MLSLFFDLSDFVSQNNSLRVSSIDGVSSILSIFYAHSDQRNTVEFAGCHTPPSLLFSIAIVFNLESL